MKAFSSLLTIFLVVLLLFAGVFMGSITGQVIKGQTADFSNVEISIVIAAILICIQLAIVSSKRKKKEIDMKEMIKEARKEVY